MKYEEIKVGDFYNVDGYKEEVTAKVDKSKYVVTVDDGGGLKKTRIMTELELHKYIEDNNIEWHRQDNDGIDDILIFPSFHQIEALHKILSPCLFDDEGIECRMKDGYFAIWMQDICSYYGVEMNNVFDGNGW